MTTENKRDLAADLVICEAATVGPWEVAPDVCGPEGMAVYETEDYGCICEVGDPYARGNNRPTENMRMIAEAREGWPESIRRAMAAEAEVERLEAFIQHESELAIEAAQEIIRLRKDKLRLHDVYDAQYARATEYSANAQRLSEALHGLLNAIERGALVKQKMSTALDYDIRRAKEALSNGEKSTQENNGR